jgi:hypothetical protein
MKNKGFRHKRTENPLHHKEKIFADQWEKENEENDSLQQLFVSGHQLSESINLRVTKRERIVVATVIQWLGSNVGFYFLEMALNKMGYKLTLK